MQVFKVFMKVLKKNLFTAIVFIVVFMGIAAMNVANSEKPDSITFYTKVAVFDEDDSPESRAFSDFLDEKFGLKNTDSQDTDLITDLLYYEDISYALVINKGFSEKLAAGETDGLYGSYTVHDSYDKFIADQAVENWTKTVSAYVAAGMTTGEAVSLAAEDLLGDSQVSFAYDSSNGNPEFTEKFASYFRFIPYIVISAILSALCPVLMTMDRKDLRYRTNCSSVAPGSYTAQIFAGGGMFVLGVWLVIVVMGAFYNKGIYQGAGWIAVLNSGIFSIITTAMAVFIASLITSQNILTLLTQVIGLGMSFLCGLFVPQSMLSDGVLTVARFLPVYWYERLNDNLCSASGYTTSDVVTCLGIQLGYAAALILLTLLVRRLKYSGSAIMTAVKAA